MTVQPNGLVCAESPGKRPNFVAGGGTAGGATAAPFGWPEDDRRNLVGGGGIGCRATAISQNVRSRRLPQRQRGHVDIRPILLEALLREPARLVPFGRAVE